MSKKKISLPLLQRVFVLIAKESPELQLDLTSNGTELTDERTKLMFKGFVLGMRTADRMLGTQDIDFAEIVEFIATSREANHRSGI